MGQVLSGWDAGRAEHQEVGGGAADPRVLDQGGWRDHSPEEDVKVYNKDAKFHLGPASRGGSGFLV